MGEVGGRGAGPWGRGAGVTFGPGEGPAVILTPPTPATPIRPRLLCTCTAFSNILQELQPLQPPPPQQDTLEEQEQARAAAAAAATAGGGAATASAHRASAAAGGDGAAAPPPAAAAAAAANGPAVSYHYLEYDFATYKLNIMPFTYLQLVGQKLLFHATQQVGCVCVYVCVCVCGCVWVGVGWGGLG